MAAAAAAADGGDGADVDGSGSAGLYGDLMKRGPALMLRPAGLALVSLFSVR